jgi:hypothetical protein
VASRGPTQVISSLVIGCKMEEPTESKAETLESRTKDIGGVWDWNGVGGSWIQGILEGESEIKEVPSSLLQHKKQHTHISQVSFSNRGETLAILHDQTIYFRRSKENFAQLHHIFELPEDKFPEWSKLFWILDDQWFVVVTSDGEFFFLEEGGKFAGSFHCNDFDLNFPISGLASRANLNDSTM